MTRAKTILVGLASLAGILILLVGIPATLWQLRGNPLPDQVPNWDQVTSALSRPDDGTLLLGVLVVIAWLGWATFAVSVLVQVPAQLRGIPAPRLPGLKLQQAGAAALVGAVAALFSVGGAITATAAPTPTHAPTIAAATAATGHHAAPAHQHQQQAQHPGEGEAQHSPRGGGQYTGQSTTVTVQPGDTLWGIAHDAYGDGTRYPDIAAASRATTQPGGRHLTDPDLIQPGWKITIPDATSQPTTAPTHPKPAPHHQQRQEQQARHGEHTSQPAAADSHAAQQQTPHQPAHPQTTARTPSPATSERFPGAAGAGAPTSAGRATLTATDTPLPRRTLTGLGALAAAGVLVLLLARRAAQSRRRRPGTRIALPTGDAQAAETALHHDADPLAAEHLDHALRALVAYTHARHTPTPALRAARITPTTLELYLVDEAAALPTPFQPIDDNPGTWTLHRDHLTDLPEPADTTDTPAPYPTLVTLGHDETNDLTLINLEEIGALAITGPPADTHAVLTALAIELLGSSWADDLRLTLVDTLPELADHLGSDRVSHVTDLNQLLTALEHATTVHAHALDTTGHDSVTTARGAGDVPDTWTPHLIFLAEQPTPAQAERIQALLEQRPRVAIAAITTGGNTALSPWILQLHTDQQATLHPADLTLTPQRLDPDGYAAIIDAFRTTDQPAQDGPTWTTTLTTSEPALEDLPQPAPAPGDDLDDAQVAEHQQSEDQDQAETEIDQHHDEVLHQPDGEQAHDLDVPQGDDQVTETSGTSEDLEQQDLDPTATPPAADQAPEEPAAQPDIQQVATAAHPATQTPQGRAEAPDTGGSVHALRQPGPTVRLLGSVEIQGADGKRPQSPAKATELIAYLALHPTASSAPLDEALWPNKRDVRATTRNGPISQARNWLGTTAAGAPHVCLFDEHGYGLAAETRVDWLEFQRYLGNDIAAAPTSALTDALRLVDGQPLSGVNPGRYAWAEVDRQEMIAAIADVAHELAGRALTAGDARTAAWAAAKGIMVEPASELLWRDALRAAYLTAAPGRVDDVATQLTETLEPIGGDLEPETIQLLDQLLHHHHDQPARAHA